MTSPKFHPLITECQSSLFCAHSKRTLAVSAASGSSQLIFPAIQIGNMTGGWNWKHKMYLCLEITGSSFNSPTLTSNFHLSWWKTYFFPPSLQPLLPSCCFTNFSFHLRSYGIFPKFSVIRPWNLAITVRVQASFNISAMWGMILSSCCARGRKVSSRGSCGSCKSKLVWMFRKVRNCPQNL